MNSLPDTNIHITQETLSLPLGGRDPRDDARNSLLQALKVHPDHALLSRANCVGLLRDFGGGRQPTITVLADCVEHGTAGSLFELSRKKVESSIIEHIADEFRKRTLYSPEICRWAVESWALGFGIKFPKLSCDTDAPPKKRRRKTKVQDSGSDSPNEQGRQKFIIHSATIPISFIVALIGANQWWARFIVGIVVWAFLFWAVTGILWLCETLVDRFEKKDTKISMPDEPSIRITYVRDKAAKSHRKPIKRKSMVILKPKK